MSALVRASCQQCGAEVTRYRSQIKKSIYCSPSCSNEARLAGLRRICKTCGKEFLSTPSKVKDGRGVYCSQECKGTSQVVSCVTCGEMFRIRQSYVLPTGNYCSRECHYKSHGRTVSIINEDGTASIPLTRGYTATIDEADVDLVAPYSWHAFPHRRTVYARATIDGRMTMLHQLLCQTPDGLVTDHIDGNGLNNRRSNLRVVTNGENLRNSYKHRQRKKTA